MLRDGGERSGVDSAGTAGPPRLEEILTHHHPEKKCSSVTVVTDNSVSRSYNYRYDVQWISPFFHVVAGNETSFPTTRA
jgi:hypothetical protein